MKSVWGLFHFQKRTGEGGPEPFWRIPTTTIQFCWPHLGILNSILHLEPPCATLSTHISNYLIPSTPALQIVFRFPPLWVTFKNGIALIVKWFFKHNFSHFHLDHCGALPYMSEMVGFDGPIYMTLPTKAICPILLVRNIYKIYCTLIMELFDKF